MSHICDSGREERDLYGLSLFPAGFVGILVMDGSSAETEISVDYVADYSDLQEYDGSGYTRQLLTNVQLTRNDTSHRDQITFDPVEFDGLDPATEDAIGMVVAIILGADENDDAQNKPLAFINTSPAFPRNGDDDSGDLVFTSASTGAVRFGG